MTLINDDRGRDLLLNVRMMKLFLFYYRDFYQNFLKSDKNFTLRKKQTKASYFEYITGIDLSTYRHQMLSANNDYNHRLLPKTQRKYMVDV